MVRDSYKVTAKWSGPTKADDQFSEEYVHYIAKPKAHEGDVYYNFNELVKSHASQSDWHL